MKSAIPYYRVSTDRQGQSGLGLNAQELIVQHWAQQNKVHLLDAFIEVESTRKERPMLNKALAECNKHNTVLVIASLDRLGRDVLFIAMLINSKVEFIALDVPDGDELILYIKAAVNQHERKQIRIRTKNALAAAKLRGVQLGRFAKEVLAERNRQKSQVFNRQMMPLFEEMKAKGFTSIRKIVDELNRLGVPTYHKGNHKWHIRTVHKIMQSVEPG